MPTTVAPPRRTQSERRATTRRALLDATAACLIDHGFAGTTTTTVCARAGVSQGALFKHFPTKQALLGAAAEHLYDLLTERFLQRFRTLERQSRASRGAGDDRTRAGAAAPDLGRRVERAMTLLWQVFASDEFAASLELELAARTDPALRAELGLVLTRHAERVRELAAVLFPDAVHDERYDRTIDLVLEVMVGMAVSRIADHGPEHYRVLLRHVTEEAHEVLTRTHRPPAPTRTAR